MKRSHSLDPSVLWSFYDSLGVTRLASYIEQLNMDSAPEDVGAPHPSRLDYVPQWEYRRDKSWLDPKEAMSFSENFHSSCTKLSLGRRNR